MPEIVSLASKIGRQLPSELVNFVRVAGELAANQGQSLYLVGGVVRDLLLRRPNFDLDLVLEGDAINLAEQLLQVRQGRIITHRRFGTAELQWDKWSVDLATARSETYVEPGALPSVSPGSIEDDLFRRDFTINAMAVVLNPNRYGLLIDLYGGRDDLEHKLIRVLHENSFADDATRIWRGLRYEQRLNFQLGENSLKLLKRNVSMLDTISGDRIRHELELVLEEEFPEKVLLRAKKLKVLPKLHPALKGDDWLAEKFEQARELSSPNSPSVGLYLALLTYRLNAKESEHLISQLRLSKALAQILKDTHNLKDKLDWLAQPGPRPSSIYRFLHDYSLSAIIANLLACNSLVIYQHIQFFLDKLRYIRPSLTGNDLKRMGITPGPRIKEVLDLLHDARLDERIMTKEGEIDLVEGWVD